MKHFALVLLLAAIAGGAEAQSQTSSPKDTTPSSEAPNIQALFPKWYAPAEPFRVIGNIYSVGSEGIAVWLIATDEGHILIDGGVPEMATMVADNIAQLGFQVSDVKYLLNTHAHFDHSGGLAELKRLSGGELIASAGDVSALEGGFYLGFEERPFFAAPPVKVDRVIADGETLNLGGTVIKANLTPGHSRGCTSWTLSIEEEGDPFETLIFCSATVAANRLVSPPQYPGIVEDYRKTFARTRDWTPDVFLSNHNEFFHSAEKRARQLEGDVSAFVDRETFPRMIARLEGEFEKALERQGVHIEE